MGIINIIIIIKNAYQKRKGKWPNRNQLTLLKREKKLSQCFWVVVLGSCGSDGVVLSFTLFDRVCVLFLSKVGIVSWPFRQNRILRKPIVFTERKNNNTTTYEYSIPSTQVQTKGDNGLRYIKTKGTTIPQHAHLAILFVCLFVLWVWHGRFGKQELYLFWS